MKQTINSKYLSTLIFILAILVVVKIFWITISLLFLPNIGEEYQKPVKAKRLYYRVKLTNESKVIAASIEAKKRAAKNSSNMTASMKGYKLLGLYHSKTMLVVTVEKGRKTEILSKGEKTKDGFTLVSAEKDFVIFNKNNQEFKLSLESIKSSKVNHNTIPSSKDHKRLDQQTSKPGDIKEINGVKHVSKTLLTSYTKNIDQIWKDIGLSQYKKNGKADGFKVNFVKKGSDIEKLGLKRGDILKAINAEPLNLSSAMRFFNSIDSLENLTLTVIRNGKSEDLEYEVQ